MGVDLSQADARIVREGSKYLKLCKMPQAEEIIHILHQEKNEF